MPCFLCESLQASIPIPITGTYSVQCPDCGHYELTFEAHEILKGVGERAYGVACWVAEQNAATVTPLINQEVLGQVLSAPIPGTKRRAELLLAHIIRSNPGRIKARIENGDKRLQISCWSKTPEDVAALSEYLAELGALEPAPNGSGYRLVAKGHIIHEELASTRAQTSQVFVAMWFDPSMAEAFDFGFAPAILASGYEPIRIDRTEHDGKIDDRIIAEIRRSAFVVADFTGHRGGVYYEAGFAHGLGRRVIFTCQEGVLGELHFDVRQYNTLTWASPGSIIKPLQNRILALLGAGPLNIGAKPIV